MSIRNVLREAELRAAADPTSVLPALRGELAQLGFAFPTIYHAIELKKTHPEVIGPLALKYYQLAVRKQEKSYLLGWLPKKSAADAIPVLLEDFCSDADNIDHWAIADTLYTFASRKYIQDYLDIIADPGYGAARQMLVLLVGRLKVERALPLLIRLLDDPSMTAHAIIALGRFRREELRPHFERFAACPDPLCRREAQKALARLEKPKDA